MEGADQTARLRADLQVISIFQFRPCRRDLVIQVPHVHLRLLQPVPRNLCCQPGAKPFNGAHHGIFQLLPAACGDYHGLRRCCFHRRGSLNRRLCLCGRLTGQRRALLFSLIPAAGQNCHGENRQAEKAEKKSTLLLHFYPPIRRAAECPAAGGISSRAQSVFHPCSVRSGRQCGNAD